VTAVTYFNCLYFLAQLSGVFHKCLGESLFANFSVLLYRRLFITNVLLKIFLTNVLQIVAFSLKRPRSFCKWITIRMFCFTFV